MSEISTEWTEFKMKKLQEKEELQAQIDEAYIKGIQDLYDAIYCLFAPRGRVPLMPIPDMHKIFGSVYADKIIINKSPEEIIAKVNQWKAEKDKEAKEEQDFHIGDEIICINECSMDYDKTFIYLGRNEYWMKKFNLDKMRTESTNNFVDYRKTGKHYDAVPLPKEESK